jgi:hypothetical protein
MLSIIMADVVLTEAVGLFKQSRNGVTQSYQPVRWLGDVTPDPEPDDRRLRLLSTTPQHDFNARRWVSIARHRFAQSVKELGSKIPSSRFQFKIHNPLEPEGFVDFAPGLPTAAMGRGKGPRGGPAVS